MLDSTQVSAGQEALSELAGSLEHRFRELTQLGQLSDRVGEGVFLADILQGVFDSFKGLIPYNRIGCALIDRQQKTVVARWARSDAECLEIFAGYSQPIHGSSLQRILDTGEPRIINDLEAYLAAHPGSESTRRIVAEGIRSSLTCPLIANGLPVGFLFFSSRRKDTYERMHHEVFLRIARQLSLVVEKSLLYEELFHLNQQLVQARQELERNATHDTLTGLLTRRALQSRLDDEVARAARNRSSVGVLMVDIDRLKQLNDTHGQAAGDVALQTVARTLTTELRSFESVGRWDGEEFMAVLDAADEAAANNVAERLRIAVEARGFEYAGKKLPLTISVGASAAVPDHPAWAHILVHAAADALGQAKLSGRNRIAFKLI